MKLKSVPPSTATRGKRTRATKPTRIQHRSPNFRLYTDFAKFAKLREGSTLYVADLSLWMPAFLAYITKDKRLLAAFRDGRDPVAEFAEIAWGQPVPPPHPDETPEERNLRDAMWMGAYSWLETLSRKMDGSGMFGYPWDNALMRPLRDARMMTTEFVDRVIQSFREAYPGVQEFRAEVDTGVAQLLDGKVPDSRLLQFEQTGKCTKIKRNGAVFDLYENLRKESTRGRKKKGGILEDTDSPARLIYARNLPFSSGEVLGRFIWLLHRDIRSQQDKRMEAHDIRVLFDEEHLILDVPQAARRWTPKRLERLLCPAQPKMPELPLQVTVRTVPDAIIHAGPPVE